jgi:hypothetical protein
MLSVTVAALLATAPLAHAQRPRPDDLPATQVVTEIAPDALLLYNDYATPSRTYAGRRAVVHYVTSGIDAPPLNDDDGDGVPDYVERVADAADTTLGFYELQGFAPLLPDDAGPDARPDIYVSRFAPATFGLAVPGARADRGSFLVVSNTLDESPGRSLGSLYGTVAHELFHLVQFSYFRPTEDPALPGWVLEGTAAAMETSVYPQLDDIVSWLQLRPWFEAPQASLTAQSYGAQLFWRYLETHDPHVLPAFLASVADSPPVSFAARLSAIYARVTGKSLALAFGDYATSAAEAYGSRITPLRRLGHGDHAAGRVAPLAVGYVRLLRGTRSATVRLRGSGSTAALTYDVEAVYAGHAPVSHRVRPRRVGGTLVFAIPPRLASSPRLVDATLVIANGRAAGGTGYSVALH